MIGLAGASLAAWAAALAPLVLGGPPKLTAAVWVALVAAALLAATRDRARWTAAVFVALVCFPVVDYLAAPPRGFVGGAPGSLAFFPADVFLAAAAVLAAARGGLPSPTQSLRCLLGLGVLYLGVLCCGGLASSRPIESWMQGIVAARGILAAAVVWIAASAGARNPMVALLLVGAMIQGALAVGQQLYRGPLGLGLLGEAPPDQLFKYIAPEVGLWRSGGTLGHPNALASYAAALLPVAVAVALSRRPVGYRALGCAAALGSGVALLCTFSRSAWAFSVVAVGGIALLSGRLRSLPTRRGLLAAGLCGVLVLAVFPVVRHRLERTESSATDVRVALALVARDMIKAYPVSGVGLGQFPNRIAEFDPELKLKLFRHPAHNILLLDGAEAGIPGMVASVLMWGGGLVTAWCCAWAAARRRDIESAGLWIGSSALILHNLVDWTLRQPAILSLFWVLVALASARPTSRHDPIADSEQLAGLPI